MGAPRRWRAAVVAVLALALAACSSGASGPPEGSAASGTSGAVAVPGADVAVASLRALPFNQGTVDTFATILARSGVEVVDDFTDSASAPVRVTRWQVENMAAELANGGGTTGRALDSLTPVPRGAPPLPFLVAAWMLEQGTPGAQFALSLYDGQDLGNAFDVRFPDGVLALFLADATTGAAATGSPGASPAGAPGRQSLHVEAVRARADIIDAPCSTVSNFVQNAIAAVADALTIKTKSGGFFAFVAGIWNTAVKLASSFVSGLIKTLTKPLLAQLIAVFNAVAAVQQVSSVLIAWRAPLTPAPEVNRFGVEPEEVTGTVVAQLQPHVLPVPAAVRDCASSVGVDITATAAGSAVAWTTTPTPRADLAATTSADKALDATEAATLRYLTGQEPPDAQDDPEQRGSFAVSAAIRRNDIERLRQFISQLLLAAVPESLQSLVESLAGPILKAATGKLAELVEVHSQTRIPITFHGTADQCRKGRIRAGTYTGKVEKDLRGAGGVTGHTSGTVTIVVDAKGGITGAIDVTTDARGGGVSSTAIERSTISGRTGKPVVTVAERIVDGKDLTTSNATTTPAMKGLCPPAIRWNLAALAPGVRASPDSWEVVATRTG